MFENTGTAREIQIRGIPLIIIDRLRPTNLEDETPAYTVISTATNNVEDDEYKSLLTHLKLSSESAEATAENLMERTEIYLHEIATRLVGDLSENNLPPEIVIAVHGFNNNFNSAQVWYRELHQYINDDSTISKRNAVFIGYRWPAENFLDRLTLNIVNAFEALPILPKNIFLGGLVTSFLLLIVLLIFSKNFLLLVFGVTTVITSLILTLIILRLVVYFRDSYRASYFGTPDLVELVRQLDQVIYQHNQNKKVKLSFLGHSLGCSVITNAIRILSDVFEPASIGSLNTRQSEKRPSDEIGRTFQLERMVLVAPDIPVESVIPRRSNFLRSALRRVKEAHVFINEGDLALRLASTAANYFSFPARTRFSGYRLGNLTVRHFEDFRDVSGAFPQYGIVNASGTSNELPFKYLEIRSSNREHRKLEEEPFYPWVATSPNDVTNRFYYYDCTDYTEDNRGVVSLAVGKPSLNLLDYAMLLFSYVLNTFNSKFGVDTHGGYFHIRSKSCKDLIYRLAFTGFSELCVSLQPNTLHEICEQKKIQVVLSPSVTYPIFPAPPGN